VSGRDMGGVWFLLGNQLQGRAAIHDCGEGAALGGTSPASPVQLGTAQLPSIVWHVTFPASISQCLGTYQKPTGNITNSDLELVASLVIKDVTAQHSDIRERTVANGSDNLPTIYWQCKGSTTMMSAPAYLLRAQALHQRYHQYHTTGFYIPGPANKTADDSSQILSLSPTALVAHCNSHFLQMISWVFAQPSNDILSSVTLALRSKQPAPASLLHEPMPRTTSGAFGKPSALTLASTRGSPTWGT
jgi:hypothetical protein